MRIAMLLIGILCFSIGALNLFGRNAVVAHHRRRASGGHIQPPMAYAVVGIIVELTGALLILGAVL